MMESGDFQNYHPAEYLSRLNLISRLKFAFFTDLFLKSYLF